jgi:pSer/pThr/pTyr-binding forkhead associated (FHA) protein
MCFGGSPGGGGSSAPVQQVAQPAPPPPQQTPRAPTIDPQVQNKRESASSQRKGTSIFRNDLTIPTGAGAVGSGVNIPGA